MKCCGQIGRFKKVGFSGGHTRKVNIYSDKPVTRLLKLVNIKLNEIT